MNRKGFTLIELLAVIVLLGLIAVFTVPNIIDAYKNSKRKSEEIFLDRLSDTIDSYVSLNSDEINFTSSFEATKQEKNNKSAVTVYQGTITIENIINDKLLSTEDYINPGNKEVSCYPDATIEVYRDSDFVYCHKIKKESLGCLTDVFNNDSYVIDTCIWSK